MRGPNKDQFSIAQYLVDGLAVAGGLLLAYWLKFSSGADPDATVATDYFQQFWVAFILWMISLQLTGSVTPHPKVISFNRGRRILHASALALMLIVFHNYFTRVEDVSRSLYPIVFLTVSTALLLGRLFLQQFIVRFMIPNGGGTRILIAGLGPVAYRLAARCQKRPELGYHLVGFVALDDAQVGRRIGGIPVLGNHHDIRRLIRDNGIEEVFVTDSSISEDTFQQLYLDSEKETARVNFVPSLAEMMRSTIHYDEVAEIPVYGMRETPLKGSNAAIKRAFDLILAIVGILILLPVFLVMTLLVRLGSKGPILYKQTRLGLDGREFKIYKFRTMRVDAEAHGPGWGGQDDPRTTPTGVWMRRWNLDELPQLWNVIRGDMSLVGPRPERPFYVDRFRELFPRYMARHAVKTGLTGWAQVHGLRGSTSIPQRLRYDLYYIENWSLWLDVKILMMTFMSPKRRPRWVHGNFGGTSGPMTPSKQSEGKNECQTEQQESHSMKKSLGLVVQAGASGAPSRSASHGPER